MKRFELKKKDLLKSSVFGVALVNKPAIEVDFVYLSKDNPKEIIKFAYNEEKGMIYSPVLIPNQDIPRVDENGEYYQVFFTEETIEELSRDYLKAGNLVGNWNSEHNDFQKLEGVNVVESWIIEDTATDKSTKLGFNLPKGTWMFGVFVENESVKEKIRSGEYKGISIEGDLEHQILNLKTQNHTDMAEKESKLDMLITKLSELVSKPTKLGSIELEEGRVYFEGDTLEESTVLYIDEAMTQLAPQGEHRTGDGRVLVVTEGGVLASIKVPEMEEVEDLNKIEVVAEAASKALEENKALTEEVAELKEANTELKSSIEKLSKLVEEHTLKLAKVSAPKSITKFEKTEEPVSSGYAKVFKSNLI